MIDSSSFRYVPASQGENYWLVGDFVSLKLTAEETAGRCTVAMLGAGPGVGPPPHVHHREDEFFYVLDGAYDFTFLNTIHTAKPGGCVFLPRDNTHAFKNVSDQPGRAFLVAIPSGFDRFVREAGDRCIDPATPHPVGDAEVARLMSACAHGGLEMQFTHHASERIGAPAAQQTLRAFGQDVRPLLTGNAHGEFGAFHLTTPAGAGLPMHVNAASDEIFLVIEGVCLFSLNGEAVTASRGDVVYVPSGVRQRMSGAGPSAAQVLNIHLSGQFERFVRDASALCPDAVNLLDRCWTPADAAALRDLFTRHAMSLID